MKPKKLSVKMPIFALPSALTVFNLSLGFLSIFATVRADFRLAGWLIVTAAVLDGLDGLIARATRTNSAFGVELDSLADAVSFATSTAILTALSTEKDFGHLSPALGFIFMAAGLWRLARYNVLQTKHKDRANYLGLTVPSAAVFIVSLILNFSQSAASFLYHHYLLSSAVILVAFLMISRIRYPNFLSHRFWRRPGLPHGLLLASIVGGLYFYPELTLLILASANVASGPLQEAWRLTRKILAARSTNDEARFG